MVGLPTNTNMYIPMSDNPSIRKVSIVNFSNNGYELGLNGPAFIMLDMSDLGLSYDVKSTGSGTISRTLKEKDITMKIAINYEPDDDGDPVTGATTYDALTFFLSKLRVNPTSLDRRGCRISSVPDLTLKWDVPTNGGITSRYRDIVVTDIQWTEVDKQYQAIIVDLTIKPIGPWYYRIILPQMNKTFSAGMNMQITPSMSYFSSSNAKLDMDLFSPFRYGIKVMPSTITDGSQYASLALQFNNTLETQAFYTYLSTADPVYMGNLRGVPYIINGSNSTAQQVLPGSSLALSPCTDGFTSSAYFMLKSSVGMTAKIDVELNVPIIT